MRVDLPTLAVAGICLGLAGCGPSGSGGATGDSGVGTSEGDASTSVGTDDTTGGEEPPWPALCPDPSFEVLITASKGVRVPLVASLPKSVVVAGNFEGVLEPLVPGQPADEDGAFVVGFDTQETAQWIHVFAGFEVQDLEVFEGGVVVVMDSADATKIVRLDGSGQIVWSRDFDATFGFNPDLAVIGGRVVVARAQSDTSAPPELQRIVLSGLDAQGAVQTTVELPQDSQWDAILGGSGDFGFLGTVGGNTLLPSRHIWAVSPDLTSAPLMVSGWSSGELLQSVVTDGSRVAVTSRIAIDVSRTDGSEAASFRFDAYGPAGEDIGEGVRDAQFWAGGVVGAVIFRGTDLYLMGTDELLDTRADPDTVHSTMLWIDEAGVVTACQLQEVFGWGMWVDRISVDGVNDLVYVGTRVRGELQMDGERVLADQDSAYVVAFPLP